MVQGGDLSDIQFDETGTASGWEDDGGDGSDGDGSSYSGIDDIQEDIDEFQEETPEADPGGTEDFQEQQDDDDGGTSGVDQIQEDVDEFQRETPEADPGGTEAYQEIQEADPDPTTTTGEELRGEADYQQDIGGVQDDLTDDPVPVQRDLSEIRFAQEETTIAGRTYREGEALPTQEQAARDVETGIIEGSTWADRNLGRGDVEVGIEDGEFQTSITEAAREREQRQAEIQQEREQEQAGRRQMAQEFLASQQPSQSLGEVEISDEQLDQASQQQQASRLGLRRETVSQPFAEQDEGGGLGVYADAILGPPGTLESEAGYAVSDPVDAIFGSPGSIESGAGDIAYGVRDASAGAADFVSETVVEPAAPYIGEAAESVPLQTTIIAPVPGDGGDVNIGGAGTTQSAEQMVGADETGDGPETVAGEAAESFAEYGGRTAVQSTVGLPAGVVETGGLAAGAGEFTATQIEEQGVVEGVETSAQAGYQFGSGAAQTAIDFAQEEPAGFAGALAGGAVASVATGAAAGRAVSATASRAGPRVRTLGGERVDIEDLASERVVSGRERFPGAADPDLYRTSPAQAVRQQATEYTPDPIMQQFERAGVTEGAPLTKALDVEPEGPGRGRAAQGFRSVGDETGIDADEITPRMTRSKTEGAFTYENPGAFVGPETSPHFLGDVGESASRGFSLRPGLPSLGEQPTATIIRTEVRKPDADTQLQFAREMARREGETTARTKPAGSEQLNPDEIEAAIPAGAEFVDVGGSGPVRNTLRRVGVGSDFYTEVQGERVPVRLAAPESEATGTTSGLRSLFADESAQLGRGSGPVRRRMDIERRSGAQQPVDRPAPVADPSPGTPATRTVGQADQSDVSTGVSAGDSASTESVFGSRTGDVSAPVPGSAGGAFGGTSDTTSESVSEPSSGPGSGPGPSSPFSPGSSGGSSEGEGPPSRPASPPPSSPPSSPPRSAPGSPVGYPPSSPPASPPGVPGQPPSSPPRIRTPDDGEDREEDVFQPIEPTGQEFENPVATGAQFLFGGGLAGSGGDADGGNGSNGDPTGLFIG